MFAAQIELASLKNRRLWWRVLWAAVLVLHAPATLHALAGLSNPPAGYRSSILLLAASNTFFILEIVFAWSLRLLSNRRNLLVFALVIVMLHVGVMEQRGLIRASDAQWLYCLLLTGIGACEWNRVIRWASNQIDRLSIATVERPRPARRIDLNELVPPDPLAAWRAAPLRAPPCALC